MRRIAIPMLAGAALLLPAAAGHAVTNTYEVEASTSPAKKTRKASKKRPVPIGLTFAYRVGEQDGLRPSPVEKYSIHIDGLRVDSRAASTCSAKRIEKAIKAARSVRKACPRRARVGHGFVRNATGASADPADRSVRCDLHLDLYNTGRNRLGLHLYGEPPTCAISVNELIDGRFKRRRSGTALEFTVKPLLLHPLPGLDNAVETVTSKVKRITRTVRKRGRKQRIGYFEAVGGCRKGRRAITVTFTGENGQRARQRGHAKC